MPSFEDNLEYWQERYDWQGAGDEWSEHWGSTGALWRESLLPRVQEYLPTTRALEIAPGFGRWTQFLKDQCASLSLVDIAPKCIEACQERFSEETHIRYYVGDGRTLEGIADRTMDFVFSFDSLVHVEMPELNSYIHEISRVIAEDGVAFIHHSNLGSFKRLARWVRRLPLKWQLFLNRHLINLSGWRCEESTAEHFRAECAAVGLSCIQQENIVWLYGRRPIDTFSTVTRSGSKWDRGYRGFNNRHFMREAKRARLSAARAVQTPENS